MSDQRDVFEIVERMKRRAEERQRAPPAPSLLQEVELGETYPCSSCGMFSFPEPTTCYWCKGDRP